MSKTPLDLKLVTEPQAFFHEMLSSALGKHRIRVQPETEIYLVNVLQQFMSSENLYVVDQDGNYRDEPLAILMKEALEQSAPHHQSLIFRKVGDVSLYVAGFFQESLGRRLVDLGYYIEMGGAAYQQVAALSENNVKQGIFGELASKFSHFVDVFGEIGEKTTPADSEKDLLKLYEIWRNTGSDRAEKTLRKAGIVPTSNSKTKKKLC